MGNSPSDSDMTLTCARCLRSFTKRSSLERHTNRCFRNLKAQSRQKACRPCAATKVRCDMGRASCVRCQARNIGCSFAVSDAAATVAAGSTLSASTVSTGSDQPGIPTDRRQSVAVSFSGGPRSPTISQPLKSYYPDGIARKLVISPERRHVLLGTAPGTPSVSFVARHTMRFIIRVLKSWPRGMAMHHHTVHLPPIMHRLQMANGVPAPLANCFTLAKMWADHTEGSAALVQSTVLHEVRRLLREYPSYDEADLLAAAQSLLVLLIILFFGLTDATRLTHPADARLLVDAWDVKHRLAATGLYLDDEADHAVPPWARWVEVSARRRTILAMHHLEYAWSMLHGYPVLTCFELGPLPAPVAGYLWRETDERCWERLYEAWLRQWDRGSYSMVEFFHIDSGGTLDPRTEMWLAEADEFGMMLMAEVNAVGDVEDADAAAAAFTLR